MSMEIDKDNDNKFNNNHDILKTIDHIVNPEER